MLRRIKCYKILQAISAMSVKVSDLIKPYEDQAVSGDFSEWLEKLELVAKFQKVGEKKSFLPLFLVGPAFAVYQQLSDAVKGDYKSLREELILAFGVNSFRAYEMLQSRVFQEGDTVYVYLADLRRLVTLIGQKTPEPLLKCAFVAGLPAEVSVQLKSIVAVESLDLNEIVSRARMILSARSDCSRTSSMSCAAGVVRNRSGNQVQCYRCSGFGHISSRCPTPSSTEMRGESVVRRRKPPVCYTCGTSGHIAKNCQQGNGKGGASVPDVPPSQN